MAQRKKQDSRTREMFIGADDQLQMLDGSPDQELLEDEAEECLGRVFPSAQVRREHYLALLAEKLKDPEFRKTPGFPKGSDDDILRMSDPPYYTACPNPFLADLVARWQEGRDPDPDYHREPFAVDVSVGKTDQLYKAHGYHTKVPHLAIVPSILHYTRPGDVVLDGFAGSGMTGVAAQWCGTAPEEYRRQLIAEWAKEGRPAPEWGVRRAVVGDLGPAASFIAANYNLPFKVRRFAEAATRILQEAEDELGWMYETLHTDGKTKGRINYTVWSEVFSCPECSGEVVFVEEALDRKSGKTKGSFSCPSCGTTVTKDCLERRFESMTDPVTGKAWRRIALRPVAINYGLDGKAYEKSLDAEDEAILERVHALPVPGAVPTNALPVDTMSHGSRIEPKGFTHVHHFFLPRAAQALGFLWGRAQAVPDLRLRNMLLFWVEEAIWTCSVLNRFRPTGYSQVKQYLTGVYYVPSQISELAPWYVLAGKVKRLAAAFSQPCALRGGAGIITGDCAHLGLGEDTVDYIFTDPPFGENIFYADLNFLVESWHGVITEPEVEAIVDHAKNKGTVEYQDLMRRCFEEYYRVLKPGRWMTVVFSNSRNAIWRAIQEALGTAGFVVADVRTLDKQQGSYRQVTSSAVKQDLVISAYKPSVALQERFQLEDSSPEGAWAFLSEHLSNVPVVVASGEEADVVVERTPQRLLDRMIAFHVQRGLALPLGSAEFLQGLDQRYPERDGMYFLPEQVAAYDRRRATALQLKQLELFVSDEASAIQWVRQKLSEKPQSFQDLSPQFMKEAQAWAKHERTVELKEMILKENFLLYDPRDPVPSQIHSYLSTQYKNLRGLEKDDPTLKRYAEDRWYVPNPHQQGDLEKLREKALLREFEGYKEGRNKLKQFRTEAVRAGFKAAYEVNDYGAIVSIGNRLPESVLQEDEKLLMYYDVASMRMG